MEQKLQIMEEVKGIGKKMILFNWCPIGISNDNIWRNVHWEFFKDGENIS